MFRKVIFILLIVFLFSAGQGGLSLSAVRIHAPADTVKLNTMISTMRESGGKVSEKMSEVATAFLGTPFGETIKNDSLGNVVINLSEFDDIDFLNSVLAMSMTLTSPNPRWREYGANLEKVGYRRGVDKGFPTKMVYGGDWIVDNISRGNVKELTEYDNNPNFKTKSLEYVTRHRDQYKALGDSAVFADMKMVEMGFRTHKIPHLKKEWASRPAIISDMKDGDIVMLLSNDPEYDVYLTGIVKMREDGPHLIYVSKEAGKVIEDANPLFRQIKKETKRIYGWRWLRAAE